MKAFHCESGYHVGDRLIRNVYDQYERRVQFRRILGATSRKEMKLYNLCASCVDKEFAAVKGEPEGQFSLGW